MNNSTFLLSDWQLDIAKPAHDAQLRTLFFQTFGHTISQEEWNWKYTDIEFRGSLLSNKSGELIGFFGGMPRAFVYRGQRYLGVQNGDVMVRTKERGIFSRRGAFYQVANHFIGQFIGPKSLYAFGFGFPHHRAYKLGIQLKLYKQAGHLQELSWAPIIPHRHWHWHWYWQPINQINRNNAALDRLWLHMQRSWFDYFLPVRDSNYWHWRYQQRPCQNYHLLLLRQRITGRPLAAVAFRIHDEYCHWLDYLGTRAHLGIAIQAAREFAKIHDKPLRALVNDAIVHHFTAEQPQEVHVKSSNIYIPTNASLTSDQTKPWIGRFWLMGGDSDFM